MNVLVQLVGLVLTMVLTALVWKQKQSNLRTLLQWNSIGVGLYLLSYLYEMAANNPQEALLACIYEYFSLSVIVILMAQFISEYCESRLSHWFRHGLFICIGVCVLMILTAKLHPLIITRYWLRDSGQGFSLLGSDKGVFYYVYAVAVVMTVLLAAVDVLVAFFRAGSSMKKRSCAVLLLACLLGLGFTLTKVTEFPGGTIMLILMTVCFLVLTSRYKIFDLTSVAKDNILQAISESIVVLNSDGEVIYCNKVAEDNFAELSTDNRDKFVAEILRAEGKSFSYGAKDYEWKSNGIYNGKQFEGVALCVSDVSYLKSNNRMLSTKIDEQTRKIKEQSRKLAESQQHIIISMAELIDSRGQGGEHFKRTSAIVALLARTLQARGFFSNTLTEGFIDRLTKAAPLYDIGKIVIPDTVLQKPGRFTEEEFEIMKAHTTEGGRLIRNTLYRLEDKKFTDMAYDMATYHHEKYGGGGYPNGISGDAIPLSARIIAIADVFDELISERPYKTALPLVKAFQMIEAGKGTHFDPVVTDVFVSLRGRIEELIRED